MRTILLTVCLTLGMSMQAFAEETNNDPMPASAAPAADAPMDSADDSADKGPLTATDKIVNRFMELDTDTTDSVSFDEYMTMVEQRARDRFASMDANEDGEVTAEEYRAFWRARKAQYYRLKR